MRAQLESVAWAPGAQRLAGIAAGILTAALGCGADESNRDSGGGAGINSAGETDETAGEAGSGPAETDGNASGNDSDDSGGGSAGANFVPKFDVGSPDGELGCDQGGGGGGGGTDFSYIWIANSAEGTVSKVNTQTLVEEGRYMTRADNAGNPSRTSVNLNGDAVIANRAGGLTMIAARPEDCPDPTNTSTGPGDVKPWPDGCVVWHTPFATDSQRPVAWSQGTYNDELCRYEDMVVWTSTHESGTTQAEIYRLNGADGSIEDQVTINGVQTHVYGIYGAAVDRDGNMWGAELSVGLLVNVDLATMAARTWAMPIAGYGMTVDQNGKVWTCAGGVARFDPVTETWATLNSISSGGNGCMEDGQGTLWVAADGFVGIDITSNPIQEVAFWALPNRVRGVSFDFEGNIWGPSINANEAYRLNPTNGNTDTVTGFNYPYTYSDMTGFALSNVGAPQG